MPMIVPHQSQAGISTANGGQAAPYRGASAFMTPGQAAAPEGLKQLARGMDKLGGAVNALLLERRNMRNAADLLADKIAYEDALRDFDSNYRQTHQGVSARDAEEAYAQFHQEQYRRLQEKWGGNPWLMQGVNQMAESIRLPSMQRAVNYRDQQEQFYQKSVLDSSEAHALELFADPSCSMAEKEAALQDHERSLRMFAGQRSVMVDGRIQWQGGRNIDAELMALRRKAAAVDIEGRIAAGDIDGAEQALDRAGGYGAWRTTPGGVNNGRSIAEDHNNPLNEKAPGKNTGTREDFKVYASLEEGLRGNWGLLQRYQDRHGRRTLNEIITRWAPPSENRTAQYIAAVSQKAGIDADAPVNMKDIPTAARVIKAMAEQESPLGKRLTVPQIEAALKGENAKRPAMYVAYENPEGLTEQGNIDIANRPQVRTEDGGTATVRSMSVNFDGAEVLLPTVSQDGRLLSEGEAIAEYKKTGKHLGKFDTPEHATAYAQKLHEQQEKMYLGPAARQQPGRAGAGWLTPKQQAAYQGQLDHIRRQQAQEAGLTAQAFGNHLEYGLDKGDFTAAEKDVEGLRSLGFTKEAAELADRLELSRTAYAALTDAGDLPLVEQGAAAKKRLDGLVTPDNARAATAMRDSVDKALAAKQAAFVKDPAAYVAALPAMQGEMSPQERVSRSLELQNRMGKGLSFEPRVLAAEQAKQLKNDYDKLDAPATRAAWLGQFANEYGPYARQALHEMKVPELVVKLLPVLGVMNEKSMGLALSAIEVKDGDIAGLDKDAKQSAVDAVANNRLMQDVLSLTRAFPANEGMRRFGKGMETMLTNYVKLGGNLEDFDKAFESSTAGDCFLMLPRNPDYSVDDVVDATKTVREDLRVKLLSDIPADTQQGRLDRANLTGLINRGVFVSDETGTKVTLVDPQHGRPVMYADGTPVAFDIATIVKERAKRNKRVQLAEETEE